MTSIVAFVLISVLSVDYVTSHRYNNSTLDAAERQLLDFTRRHPVPVGLLTTSAGEPVDIRDTITHNTDIFVNQHHIDRMSHLDVERIPERVVHARGTGAFGYFEVTNDVSKYTSADVFNGVGKKTPLVARFSTAIQNLGGAELGREPKAVAFKLYTKEGNLDLLCLNAPVYFYKDPIDFSSFVHAFRRNPRTTLFDMTSVWDFITLRPDVLHAFLWILSDLGIPNGYRKMDVFPIHTYEISNKHEERYYVKFNFRTDQGLVNLTSLEAMAIGAMDPDYYSRDLYNAIAEKNYPSWRLEMDVMTMHDAKSVDYNPFDVTVLWKPGTYHTVQVGRVVLNRPVDNNFRDSEQSAFNPANLVPGIPGPVDVMFKARRISYRDTQNYRLGINHNKIEVNTPLYAKTYNRDGVPPVRENMRDAPNYYPNSFNGPMPFVDEKRPRKKILVLESNAADLAQSADFYNRVVESDAHRQRIADNIAASLAKAAPNMVKRAIKLFTLVEPDLGKRVTLALRRILAAPEPDINKIGQCLAMGT